MRVLASSLTFSACPSGRSGIKKSRGPNLSRSSRLQPNSVVALYVGADEAICVDVAQHDRIRRLFNQEAESLLAGLEQVRGALAFGNVPKEPDTAEIGAIVEPARSGVAIQSPAVLERDFISAGLIDLRIEFPYARQKDFAVGDLSSDHLQHRRLRFAGDQFRWNFPNLDEPLIVGNDLLLRINQQDAVE